MVRDSKNHQPQWEPTKTAFIGVICNKEQFAPPRTNGKKRVRFPLGSPFFLHLPPFTEWPVATDRTDTVGRQRAPPHVAAAILAASERGILPRVQSPTPLFARKLGERDCTRNVKTTRAGVPTARIQQPRQGRHVYSLGLLF
jgi:hypothetical protein